MSGGQTEKQVQLIIDFKPTIVLATPSYMLTIADELFRQGVDPSSTSLRIGVFGAEPWTNEMRKEIEARLGIDAIDIYGLSEVIGPGVACECVETKDGPHIWEDHFYPEIVNPETGEVLPDGEIGELVFTSLSKEALPMIRYRTRDLTRLLPGTARTMRRMEKITGRSDDMLIIRGVNVFPTQIEEILLRHPALCAQYQIHVSRDGHMDEMAVFVELDPQLSGTLSAARMREIGDEVRHQIKTLIGVSAQINVVENDKVERTLVGKARRVIDKRPKS
jgi:phenylacetate-CoA ligase